MSTQQAEVVADSIGQHSPRLTTFRVRQIRFIHSEFLRHRMLSFSAGSSRAIPVAKLIAEVQNEETRAEPIWWGREQKGMSSGDELFGDALVDAKGAFDDAARDAAINARHLSAIGVHKSIVNRVLEPYSHINVVATGVEDAWLNFFGLRLDKAAQPEMRDLAERMWAEWNKSEPKKLRPGEWHLPFIEPDDYDNFDGEIWAGELDVVREAVIKVSAARCARTSYTSYETGKRSTVEEDLRLYDKLVGSTPMHAGPLEHQATPDVSYQGSSIGENGMAVVGIRWNHPSQHGNLYGWRQYRKMLPGERIAPLPQGYVYRKPSF